MRERFAALLAWMKRFFFPPAGSPRWVRVLPYAVLGALTALVLAGGTYTWTYTNSSEFCGTTCHTMPPEYSAYLVSPHARVQCVECHIGRDVITTQVTRKAGDVRHIVLNITKTYEYPIRASNMRPARESCETCHFPEKFSDDSLREVRHYQPDERNSLATIFLIMKTGGGSQREGWGRASTGTSRARCTSWRSTTTSRRFLTCGWWPPMAR
jgi:nitrate/TMAO reductase-like tetraheme cytochrome c subunit